MAKGWKLVGCNGLSYGDARTKEEKKIDDMHNARTFNRIMKTTEKRSYEDMVKDINKLFESQKASEVALLQAYSEKKLKSKTLIKQAKEIKKKQSAKSSS